MHRLIAGSGKGDHTDHRDEDGLNNRRANVRRCSHAQNVQHRKASAANKLGVRGARRDNGRIRVEIITDGKRQTVGTFATLEDARRARQEAEAALWGEFAYRPPIRR